MAIPPEPAAMRSEFDLFIGVDWSGAKGPLKAFQVAVCEPGTRAPQLVRPPGRSWQRADFAHWLSARIEETPRLLCGMDFSFCFPFVDENAYLPGLPAQTAPEFWAWLESISPAEDFYGGDLPQRPEFADFFNQRGISENRYRTRHRVTDQTGAQQGFGQPSTVFNLVGAAQVGKSSLSGMRVLHWLKARHPQLVIWPFDEITPSCPVLVETFPAGWLQQAGHRGKARDARTLNKALAFYGSAPRRKRLNS
ncbi:MAG: hypothetical protein R3360_01315, partial [Alphaproteobacteria bacterium]|nr:hypothetical protein [Alphaproteobacteria bacterium]